MLLLAGLTAFAGIALTRAWPQGTWPWTLNSQTRVHHMLVQCGLTLSILPSFVLGYMGVMRLVRRLERLSHHDGLTGLLHRRASGADLDREVRRMQRFGEPFSVVLIDIDYFKRINDRLGHAAGDAVLATVAQTLLAWSGCVEAPAESLSMLLRRADEALHTAKAAGRNRVIKAPPFAHALRGKWRQHARNPQR